MTSTQFPLIPTPLEQLQARLQEGGWGGMLVPRTDAYQSEYIAPHAERLRWLTGFTGSAGTLFVGVQRAALFSDGRYILQMREEVTHPLIDTLHSQECPPLLFLAHLNLTKPVAYDPWLHTVAEAQKWAVKCPAVIFKPTPINWIDTLWTDQPPAPAAPLRLQPEAYAGQSAAAKIQMVCEILHKEGADAVVLSRPESVCWLLNIRGQDVPHVPVALVRAVVHAGGKVSLLIQGHPVSKEVRTGLPADVQILEEADFPWDQFAGQTVMIDPETLPLALAQQLEAQNAILLPKKDPCLLPKATKNKAEITGATSAHIRDGVALVNFLAWFEAHALGETELSCSARLLQERAQQSLFLEPSFPTIAASGDHGAIIHYHPTAASDRPIQNHTLFLLDSGGQYQDGTTDVTRTVAVGTVTAAQQHQFTRVLQGHIALASAHFPEGTPGEALDSLARQYLWRDHLDYDHGTGHGVGSCLSVHEGPQRLSRGTGSVPLQPGMIVSNEPGYYLEGSHGIRIENLMVVEAAPSLPDTRKRWLCFRTLTLVPLDRRLIDLSLLSAPEVQWVNAYHQQVYQTLSSHLEPQVQAWLKQATAPLS